jgi:osmotically-inducible protein OsmY
MKTDLEIQKDVLEELKWEPLITASEIGVAVKKGVVTLSGIVDSYLKKTTAEKATKRVNGVKAVAEDIIVKSIGSFIKTDTEIAQAALNALKWNNAINEEKIKIKVEDGVVTLDGEVEWEFQKIAAQRQIENLIGVRRILNNVTLKTSIPAKDLKLKISNAFHRSATLDSEKILIETSGNKVILKGNVRSWAEKNDAENAVWSAPGVTKVDNQLEIKSEVLVY